jgi:hypothetical protein
MMRFHLMIRLILHGMKAHQMDIESVDRALGLQNLGTGFQNLGARRFVCTRRLGFPALILRMHGCCHQHSSDEKRQLKESNLHAECSSSSFQGASLENLADHVNSVDTGEITKGLLFMVDWAD